ncbi:MAG: hypothetical protein EP343_03600 [Deltaproteobacteria bacterium]|nr:MAG: hypothetical protein EP343_03600 [Deltaproteobacteria bacterium]
MTVRLQNATLQNLVEQLTSQSSKLSEADVNTLIDAAFEQGGTLSADEQASLQTLLEGHPDLFESSSARERLSAFQSITDGDIRDAAHRFASDGKITSTEARELQEIALRDGSLSQPETMSLKALMGFYSPELESGAKTLLQELTAAGPVDAPSPSPDSEVDAAAQALHVSLTEGGTIERSAIEEAEVQLAAQYGPEKAKDILIRALGQDPAKISFDAIDYLQGNIGSMDDHVDEYQDVLVDRLEGAKLLDANFDGKLDENDLIFRKGANGEVNVERIGKSLRDRVFIGAAMVDAAGEMAKAKHKFGDLEANPVVWEVDEDNPNTMYLNSEFEPSVALMDIFNNPELYSFECATAMVILRYRAMLEMIGEDDFNRICGDLRIGVWDQEDDAAAIWEVTGKSAKGEDVDMTEETQKEVLPGDYAYFKNWDVSEAAFKGGWQGENVIYLGKGKYYGHPFGITEGTKIIDYLNKHRKTGSTRSASLLDLHARVHEDVLAYDKNTNE